jgi:uncharacterized membrane protein YcaP (DUF421 family)
VLFNGWGSIGRVVLAGVAAYALLVLMLRLSGKRTLSKLNAFDLVVTVALGSTLSSVILDRSIALADGLAALALLIGLQYAVAWAATRSIRFDRIVKSEPRVLYYRGAFARDAMRDERITEDAVLAAIRSARIAHLDSVDAVVLESSGDLSVLRGAPRDLRRATLPHRPSTSPGAQGDQPSRS